DMLIDIAIDKLQGLISFFTAYREIGFLKALEINYFLPIVEQGYEKIFGFFGPQFDVDGKGLHTELNGLAIIALENGILEKIKYEDLSISIYLFFVFMSMHKLPITMGILSFRNIWLLEQENFLLVSKEEMDF
ncbi:hypothetical protein ACJX0J_037602, partial [Zea mays]